MKELHGFVLLAVLCTELGQDVGGGWGGVSIDTVLCKVTDSSLKLHLKAKVFFFFFKYYPVASQMSVQLVLLHLHPANLDHRAVYRLHGDVVRCSRGNCKGKRALAS